MWKIFIVSKNLKDIQAVLKHVVNSLPKLSPCTWGILFECHLFESKNKLVWVSNNQNQTQKSINFC